MQHLEVSAAVRHI